MIGPHGKGAPGVRLAGYDIENPRYQNPDRPVRPGEKIFGYLVESKSSKEGYPKIDPPLVSRLSKYSE
jgi:hypothetical protein